MELNSDYDPNAFSYGSSLLRASGWKGVEAVAQRGKKAVDTSTCTVLMECDPFDELQGSEPL